MHVPPSSSNHHILVKLYPALQPAIAYVLLPLAVAQSEEQCWLLSTSKAECHVSQQKKGNVRLR